MEEFRFYHIGDAIVTIIGIAATKLLSINVVIRELDLSFSSITTDGGLNLLDAIIENHSLKVLLLTFFSL